MSEKNRKNSKLELYNINIERALLSTILYDPQIFNDISEMLDSSDFGHGNHEIIFNIMRDLHVRDYPINEDFIRKNIPKNKNFDNDIIDIASNATVANYKDYVEEIKDLSLKRKLHNLSINIASQSLALDISSKQILENIEKEIFNIGQNRSMRDFKHFKKITGEVLKNIKIQKEQGNKILVGLSTGFDELDKVTKGLKEGELIIVAARPGMGKTAFAISLMQKSLENKKTVAFFSLEMDAEQIALRMFSSITSIPMQELMVGNLDNNEWDNFSKTCNKADSWNLFIDDNGGLNITQLRSKIRKLKNQHADLSLVIVDYLQLMSGDGSQKDRHLEISEISRGLKNLAREIKIPIVALSQLNRMLESRDDRRPRLSDLRESGAIEQDADVILFLYRDYLYKIWDQKTRFAELRKKGKEPNEERLELKEVEEVELIIGKNRNGEANKSIKLNLHTKYTRFVNASMRDQAQMETKIIDI